jgi:anti-sigma factor RsiW
MDHREAVESMASERYLLDEMGAGERDAFEEHFFTCDACAEDMRAGSRMIEETRAGALSGQARAAAGNVLPMPTRQRRLAAVVPWAVAASLAIVASYQAVIVQPALRRGPGPLALVPQTLRTDTRGAEPVVSVGPGGMVTLAIALADDATDGEIEYELKTADGTSIVAARVAAPLAGSPLLLLLPAALVPPGQGYVLVVRDPAQRDLTFGEYRFRL